MAAEFGVPYDPDKDFRTIFGRHNTDIISSLWDVTRGKPDPQVFLVAFQRLGVGPRNGVVIEDAPAGVQAAIAAGAACLAVTNTQSAETLRSVGAHLIVPTLEGLTVADLEDLIQ